MTASARRRESHPAACVMAIAELIRPVASGCGTGPFPVFAAYRSHDQPPRLLPARRSARRSYRLPGRQDDALNHTRHPAGSRVAVLENEFGAGHRRGLIGSPWGRGGGATDGCICCSVRANCRWRWRIWPTGATGAVEFRPPGALETTGLADPARWPRLSWMKARDRYELDGILTVVDAIHAGRQLNETASLPPRSALPTGCSSPRPMAWMPTPSPPCRIARPHQRPSAGCASAGG